MADDDDDDIVVCCATLTTFTREYLFEQSRCKRQLAVIAEYKIRPTQETINATDYLLNNQNYWQLSARPILYLPQKIGMEA